MMPCLLAALSLAACGSEAARQQDDDDPALAAALAGPILTDLDLVQQDLSHVAIAGGGPPVIQLPPIEHDPDALAAIREEARRIAGAGVVDLPEAQGAPAAGLASALTLGQLLDAMPHKAVTCEGKAQPGLGWSLHLPAVLPIYPRGHLIDAAGIEATSCQKIAVSFLSPAAGDDIAAFYSAMGRKSGYSVKRRVDGAMQVVAGTKSRSDFVARIAAGQSATTVDLALRQSQVLP